MAALSWDAVFARRLARHHLLRPAPRARLADVVSELCGIHAQVIPSAELSLGLRIVGFRARDLADALWERRELVKIYGLRGTVHLVPAREYGWWLAVLRAMRGDGRDIDPARLRYLGITERQFFDASEAIVDAVGTRPLTREQLGDLVARRVGRWATRTVGAFGGQWPVWQAALGHAALEGGLIFGPTEGVRVTFQRAADWIGRIRTPAAGAALGELFLRYLRAYGPASERDFAQWSTLPPARARAIRAACNERVSEVTVGGMAMLQIAGDRPARGARSTLLLPRFDVYAVGSYPRDTVAPPEIVARAAATGLLRERSGTGRAFLFGPMPVLVVDGVISGIWESKRSSKRVAIRVQPFVTLAAARRAAVARAAKRIGEIVGLEADLEIGAVTTRPHL